MRIALAGNPNSGKTSMYNALTGKSEKVGNWAGVTVDKNEHPIKKSFYKGEEKLIVVDLPGAYSMSPFTSEESITSSYVKNENPDVLINIVDATNLSRSLFFTTQLLELGIPVVVALNKTDINAKKKTRIDASLLSQKLGCPVVETVSTTGEGLKTAILTAVRLIGQVQKAPYTQGITDLTDKASVQAEDKKRFEYVNALVDQVESRLIRTNKKNIHDKIDAILINRWLGIPIFAIVMWAVFYISQSTLGNWIANGFETKSGRVIPGLVTYIEMFGEVVSGWMDGASPILQTIVIDGIIGGVGAVVGFLPLVMIMYFLIALLEDCGYMARVSVLLDPIFKHVGLSGKSIIPMVISTGCTIPGIMACRTIRDEKEKRAAAILAPFIPCGAKIPVIALFAGAFFPDKSYISPIMYFAGILLVLIWALIIKWMTGYKHKKTFFIIELPEYKLPGLGKAVSSMLDRGKAYIIKAGTIILICSAVVTIMASYTCSFEFVDDPTTAVTLLETIAKPFAFLLIPLGFGLWQFAAASITGFIAKEEIVGTLAAVFAIGETVISGDFELVGSAGELASAIGIGPWAALAYLMFNLYSPPCFGAIGAMNSEIKSKRWMFGGIGLQLATGYIVAFLVYQFGTLISTGKVGAAFIPGLIAVLVMISIIVIIGIRCRKSIEAQYAAKAQAKAKQDVKI